MGGNARSLERIADDVHRLDRASIIGIGDLLLEAKASCEHGESGQWLKQEFEWSNDTAERFMAVARLATRYRQLRELQLSRTTLYALLKKDEKDSPTIVDELAKHATQSRLKASDAVAVMAIGRARGIFGDYPEATLKALDRILSARHAGWLARSRHGRARAAAAADHQGGQETARRRSPRRRGGALRPARQPARAAGHCAPPPGGRDHGAGRAPRPGSATAVGGGAAAHRGAGAPNLFDARARWGRPRQRPRRDPCPVPAAAPPLLPSAASPAPPAPPPPAAAAAAPPPAPVVAAPVSSPPSLAPELLVALRTILQHARRPLPTVVGGLSGPDLIEVARYVEGLHQVLCGGDQVKRAADRAEARARTPSA